MTVPESAYDNNNSIVSGTELSIHKRKSGSNQSAGAPSPIFSHLRFGHTPECDIVTVGWDE